MSEANTLFEIDRELDSLLDQIEEEAEENGTASPELLERFQQFCQAESDKVDRIGRIPDVDGHPNQCRPPKQLTGQRDCKRGRRNQPGTTFASPQLRL
jgi:hypothetical protein